jgi:hypothetical protein
MDVAPDLYVVAEHITWFESAEEALRYPKRFLAYVMTFGLIEDVVTVRRYFADRDFEAVLLDPPAGIFDIRSWHYWNGVYGHHPIPPLPQRIIST